MNSIKPDLPLVMYNAFLASVLETYKRTYENMRFYSVVLQKSIQDAVLRVMNESLQTVDRGGNEDVLIKEMNIQGEHSSVLLSLQEVVYCDFSQHHMISRDEWIQQCQARLSVSISDVEKYFLSEPKRIYLTLEGIQERFNSIAVSYTWCLQDPLFSREHYVQYQAKHIGMQVRNENIYHAFVFSPEEMLLYKNLESILHVWRSIKDDIMRRCVELLADIEIIRQFYSKIALLYPDEFLNIHELLAGLRILEQKIGKTLELMRSFDMNMHMLPEKQAHENSHMATVSFLNKK